MYALLVIYTFGKPVADTDLLGHTTQRPMQPTMMAFATATPDAQCQQVLGEERQRIQTIFKTATALQIQQGECVSEQEALQYLQVMHAVPIDTKGETRAYVLPM